MSDAAAVERLYVAVRAQIMAWAAVGGMRDHDLDDRIVPVIEEGSLSLMVYPYSNGDLWINAEVPATYVHEGRYGVKKIELDAGYDPGPFLRRLMTDLVLWRDDPDHLFQGYFTSSIGAIRGPLENFPIPPRTTMLGPTFDQRVAQIEQEMGIEKSSRRLVLPDARGHGSKLVVEMPGDGHAHFIIGGSKVELDQGTGLVLLAWLKERAL